MKKNSMRLIELLILIIVTSQLTACGIGRPNEKNIAADLNSSSVVVQEIDEAQQNMPVVSVHETKSQLNGKEYITYCDVEQKNENFSTSSAYKLLYNYYDNGGWILDDWELLSENITPLTGASQEKLDDIIFSQNCNVSSYAIISDTLDLQNFTHTYHYKEYIRYNYMEKENTCISTFVFDQNQKKWIANIEKISSKNQWDIDGTWQCEKPIKSSIWYFPEEQLSFTITIHSFNEEEIDCDYNYHFSRNEEVISKKGVMNVHLNSDGSTCTLNLTDRAFTSDPYLVITPNDGLRLVSSESYYPSQPLCTRISQ